MPLRYRCTMRVDLLTREYPPEVYGGAGVHVAELVRALRRDLDVVVRCFGAVRDEPGTFGYATPAEFAAYSEEEEAVNGTQPESSPEAASEAAPATEPEPAAVAAEGAPASEPEPAAVAAEGAPAAIAAEGAPAAEPELRGEAAQRT